MLKRCWVSLRARKMGSVVGMVREARQAAVQVDMASRRVSRESDSSSARSSALRMKA